MNYQVYTTAAMTSILGNGIGGSVTESIITDGTGAGQFTWYFSVPAGQTPPVGTYTDTLGITMTF
jgi:spore coat protein U-like protein